LQRLWQLQHMALPVVDLLCDFLKSDFAVSIL
jgi:hypothetical protein